MNNVVLIGNIASELNIRYTEGTQMAILRFSLAVNRAGKDKETDFPRIVVFGKQAENTNQYCRKGSKVGIQGRIQTGSYTDKDGNKVYTTDVIADRVEFLSVKQDTTEPTQEDYEVQMGFQAVAEDVPF